MRLNQHRGRRLDEQLEGRTPHNDHSSPGSAPTALNSATEPRQTIPITAPEPRVIDQAQLEAALARLPAPLAAQLARLATRHPPPATRHPPPATSHQIIQQPDHGASALKASGSSHEYGNDGDPTE